MYARGEGVTQDGMEAVRWFRAAAEQDDPRGELNLAMAHWMGLGIPRDVIEAYLWASLSAAKGNEEGKELQAAIRQEMTPSQIAKAQRLAKVSKAYTPSSLPQSKPKRSWSASH